MPSRQETDGWVEGVYHAPDRAHLEKIYDDWAASYDTDLQQVGYLHLPVIVGLMCRHVQDKSGIILDAGVGTGMIGEVLALLGFLNLWGIDMSEGMLAKARTRGCYADLRKAVLGESLNLPFNHFDGVVSTGTFTKGHAPASALKDLVQVLKPGGVLMFTVGVSIWDADGFSHVIEGLLRDKAIVEVDVTPEYAPMPFSPAERDYKTWARTYRKQ